MEHLLKRDLRDINITLNVMIKHLKTTGKHFYGPQKLI